MTGFWANLAANVKAFHDDEDGIEQLNIVMILAVAGLVVIFIFAFGIS